MSASLFKFTGSFPWWVKLGLLLTGIFKPVIGLFLIILDGFFHATLKGPELPLKSPDWIIAKHLFKRDGFSEDVHKIMGIVLIVSAAYVMWSISKSSSTNLFTTFYLKWLMPITLLIISLAVALKAYFGEKGGVAFL